MGMFGDNWMGGGAKKPAPAQQQQNNGGGQQQQQDNKSTQGNGGQNGDNGTNNGGNNDDLINTIWDDVKKDNKAADPNNNNQQNNQQQQQQQQQPDLQKQTTDYLASVGLGDLALSEAEIENLKSGEGFAAFAKNINGRIQQAHLKALSNANQLIDKKVEAAVAQAVDKSKSFYQGEQIREILRDKLEIAKDPLYAPVVETITRQFLSKGATLDQAIDGTKKYLEKLSQKMDPNAPNANTKNGFRGNPRQQDDNTNWLDVLGAKNG